MACYEESCGICSVGVDDSGYRKLVRAGQAVQKQHHAALPDASITGTNRLISKCPLHSEAYDL